MQCACKTCKERTIDCHSNCAKYKEFRDWLNKKKEEEKYLSTDVSSGWGYCRSRKIK